MAEWRNRRLVGSAALAAALLLVISLWGSYGRPVSRVPFGQPVEGDQSADLALAEPPPDGAERRGPALAVGIDDPIAPSQVQEASLGSIAGRITSQSGEFEDTAERRR